MSFEMHHIYMDEEKRGRREIVIIVECKDKQMASIWHELTRFSFFSIDFLMLTVGRIGTILTLRLLYGRSMRTLAAIDESQKSWSRPPDVGGGRDVIDTDCFIGLVEWVCLSVIEVSILCKFSVCVCFPSFVYWQRREVNSSLKKDQIQFQFKLLELNCVYFRVYLVGLEIGFNFVTKDLPLVGFTFLKFDLRIPLTRKGKVQMNIASCVRCLYSFLLKKSTAVRCYCRWCCMFCK